MENRKIENIKKVGISTLFLVIFLFGFSYVANAAWTNPSQAPTGGNRPTPINVSDTNQSKVGGLSIGGNFSVGSLIQFNSLEGSITADEFIGSEFLYNSDRRLKKDIEPISNESINSIFELRGVSYKWKKDNQKDFGFIAQDVEEIYPELVKTDDDSGYKSVKYVSLIAPLIEINKQQQEKINELEARIELIEKQL